MRLIILGSGTCVPSLKRNAAGYYLESDNCQVLIDCGSGTLLQLERAGRSYKELDAVFITHLHPDHFADLMPLIHALLSTPGFKREKPLLVIGPEGFRGYYDRAFTPIFGERGAFLHIVEINDQLDLEPFHITTAMTEHSKNSIAYRFEAEGRSIVFTGDAVYDDVIIGFSEGADLLIADASFPHSMKKKDHLTSRECGMVAKEAGVKRLLLSHIYQVEVPDAERLSECNELFSGDVSLAEDLMELEI